MGFDKHMSYVPSITQPYGFTTLKIRYIIFKYKKYLNRKQSILNTLKARKW